MAKIVDVQALQVGCLGAGTQERARSSEPAATPTRGGKDMAAGPLRGGKMSLQLTDDEGRQPDGRRPGTVLGRAGDQLALDLGEDLGHGDRPASRSTRRGRSPASFPIRRPPQAPTNTSAR